MFATIDIGTNSVLLLIASPLPSAGEGLGVRADLARITRLGEGLHESQYFLPSAMERTLQALEEYHRLCQKHEVTKVVCVGTAAFRKAQNGKEFMGEIKKKFGWETRIISGEEEARLSYLSVERDFGIPPRPPLKLRGGRGGIWALDIGGGSTEIISREGGVSLELGTVVLSERYLRHDPPTGEEIKQINSEIDRMIVRNLEQASIRGVGFTPHREAELAVQPWQTRWGAGGRAGSPPNLIALAGTATTLSSVNQKLKKWDPSKIQGSIIKLTELKELIAFFQHTTHDALRTTPGMIPDREDTILAGSLILKAVMEKLGTKRVIVSDRGLRYGVFYARIL